MRQDYISKRDGSLKLTLSRPHLQQDASKYVNMFESALAPFYKNPNLSHETRMRLLDNIMVMWVKCQRHILTEDSPSFHQMLINEGLINEQDRNQ